jgi:rSAM/selenodomain-associated transferase 1
MPKKQLLIIFVKNIVLGKVKTRLAKTIGNTGAFNIYKQLFDITLKESIKVNCTRHIYFSDVIINAPWPNDAKFVQSGSDLGIRMSNAFKHGFEQGFEEIILIGSDLPEISQNIINSGFKALVQNKTVFGPALDGGYYLVGMTEFIPDIFLNKRWSQPQLLKETLKELTSLKISSGEITPLNDIDNLDDLNKSTLNSPYKTQE